MSSVSCGAGAMKSSSRDGGCVPTKVASEHRTFSLEDGCEVGLDVLLVCMKVANGEMGMGGAMRWCAQWYGQRELEQIFCRLLMCGLESRDSGLSGRLLDGTCWSYDQGDRVVCMSCQETLVGPLGSDEWEREWIVETVMKDGSAVREVRSKDYRWIAEEFLHEVTS